MADEGRDNSNDICKIMLKDVRLSYPTLFRAKAFGDGSQGEPAYSAEFLISKDSTLGKKQIDMIWDAIDFCKDKLREKNGKDVKIAKDKPFFKDGDDSDYERPETIGHRIVSARNVKKPRVLGIDKEDLHESDGVIYAGCRVDAIVRVWAQDNKFGKRVNCSLEAVRFRADGEAFGAAPINPDEFEDIGGGRDERRGSRDDRDDRGGRDRDDRGGRDRDDDRDSRRSRDAEGASDDRDSRRGSRDDDRGGRDDRSGRDSRDEDDRRSSRDDRDTRGSRDERDDRRGGRDDDRGDDRGRGESRGRGDDDRRGSGRDDDDRGRDRDDDRRGGRGRDVDDRDRPSENSRSGRASRRNESDDI